ncbi:hypothetical protein FKN01_29740 [Streptomyces sp. 130]|uniref:hypothetical protein n=1 Tax=Streptomyces sp. 130 TaxID=2591006 RepID=UPI001180C3BA|nr:hypothetical protein [Streptomyces sp. 130]TRV72573.1 hypothetical protein FKN01_29740 [Streptomyces sp. 130]
MFVTRSKYDALYDRYVEMVAQRDDAIEDAKESAASVHQLATAAGRLDLEAVRARALAGQVRSAGRLGRRLMRALRVCARYRAENAALRREVAAARAAYDHAVGLDSPALDMGVHWQQRRSDRVVPKAVES